jgi:hypothetical protein
MARRGITAAILLTLAAMTPAAEPTRAGPDWWSLQPIKRLTIPRVSNDIWSRNPIDPFILAKLRSHGLEPAVEADRETYIRRVTFDLIGLPPTPAEIDAFLKDRSPDAAERLVDRLLASPHYGERWARHWLDVARFGESDGFENDKLREHSWVYRDYVIRSFNADKPYPQFVAEQVAGDVMEPITRDGMAATGFLVAGPWDEIQNVTKSRIEKLRCREEQQEELVAAMSQAFLGLTVQCARCHDHKFDPIPQHDYYAIKAAFDGVDHGSRPLLTPAQLKGLDQQTAPLKRRADELKSALAMIGGRLAAPAKTAPASLAAGRFGRGFDPRHGRLTIAPKPEYRTPPLTVECWTKLDSKRGYNVMVAHLDKTSADHWEIYTHLNSGFFSAYLPGYAPADIVSNADIADGRWHHVAMTFDGSLVKLWVDGRMVREQAVRRAHANQAGGALWIGGYGPTQIGCDGIVDEVRISKVVRTFERQPDAPPATDSTTVALWHFDSVESSPVPPSRLERGVLDALKRIGNAELARVEARLAAAKPPMGYIGTRFQPEPSVMFTRGDVRQPGAIVKPGVLSAVRVAGEPFATSPGAPEARRRLMFASWLTHPENPLTSRVMVNRIWHWHFGTGIVDTPSDFGYNGGRPSHPELLDWLASEFIRDGGSIKRLHKLIVLSATYRQSSAANPKAKLIDADNRLLWRFPARRLEAEAVRDAMLAAGGNLNRQIGGPSFRPFTVTVFNTHFYHLFDKDEPEFNRRTLYRMSIQTGKSPFLAALDCPSPSAVTPKRQMTTTPLQALALMNDPFVQRQANYLAARVTREAGADVERQVALAYRLTLGRSPKAPEREAAVKVACDHGLPTVCWALFNSSEFVMVK